MEKISKEGKKEIEKLRKEAIESAERLPKKIIKPSFDVIDNLRCTGDIHFSIPSKGIEYEPARLIKHQSGGFKLEIDNLINEIEEPCDIVLIINEIRYIVSDVYFQFSGGTISRNTHNDLFSGTLGSAAFLHSLNLDTENKEDSYRRCVLPIGESIIGSFVQTEWYRTEWNNGAGLVILSINDISFDFYQAKYGSDYFFVVDSKIEVSFDIFSDICNAITLAFGFLSANFYQNEAYFLSSDDESFEIISRVEYKQLRESILMCGAYNPIISNPYQYSKDDKIIEKVGTSIRVFNAAEFSSLCNRLFSDENYQELILLIIESNAGSLILQPAGYAVALEKITNIVVEENGGLKPIPDKRLSSKFLKAMREVLKSMKEEINEVGNEDSIVILGKNIDKMNSPTNRDKLTKPFNIYEIDLDAKDQEAIANRNNFLHGRGLNVAEGTDLFNEVWETSMRLNGMINKLILKHLGYSGYVINHVKRYEVALGKEIGKELFEKI